MVRFSRWPLLLIGLIAASSGASLCADEAISRLPIELAPIRWQALPQQVIGVYVGPDGRTWQQLRPLPVALSPQEIKATLEREYREPAPQVSCALIALIEPERVWFYVNSSSALWGYDGREWISRELATNNRFMGYCPNRGQFLDNRVNRYAGGRSFFLDRQGVQIYDGKQWQHHALSGKPGINLNDLRYATSPDGKRLAVFEPSKKRLAMFTDGKWRDTVLESAPGGHSIKAFCVTNAGQVWHVHSYGQLASLYMSDPPAAPKPQDIAATVAALVAQLDAEEFETREQATQDLRDMGSAIKSQLEEQLKKTTSLEAQARLASVLEKMPAAPDLSRKLSDTEFGACRVSQCMAIYHDMDGTILLTANAIQRDNGPAVAGLVIQSPTGQTNVIESPDVAAASSLFDAHTCPPLVAADGGSIWLRSGPGGKPTVRMDLRKKTVIDEIPDARFSYVQAVDEQGRIFVSRSFYAGSLLDPGMMVYSPNAPDNRIQLTGATVELANHGVLIGSGGAMWANLADKGLTRFDGNAWSIIRRDVDAQARPMLRGKNDVVVIGGMSDFHLLYQGDQLIAEGQLRKIVEDHHELIAAAFPSDWQQDQARGFSDQLQLGADTGGNIWLLAGGGAEVLVAGKWLKTTESLKAAGSRRGTTRLMRAMGDGFFYLSEQSSAGERGKAFMASIREGSVHVQVEPHGSYPSGMSPQGIRDAKGGLWIANHVTRNLGAGDSITGQSTLRLLSNSAEKEYINRGWPLFADASGNVWLGIIRGQPRNRLKIWREGEIVQELEIPGTDQPQAFFSDKPGSVYAWTELGLQHLVASEKDGKYRYVLQEKTYALPKLVGNGIVFSYSPLGYLAIAEPRDYAGNSRLHIIRWPEK